MPDTLVKGPWGFKAGKTDMADSLHKNNRGILGRLQDYDEYVTHKLYQLGLCVPRFVWKALEYSGDGFVWLALASLLLVGHAVVLEKEQEALSRTWYGLVLHRIGMVDELLGPNLMLGLLVDLVEVGLLKGLFQEAKARAQCSGWGYEDSGGCGCSFFPIWSFI